MLTAIVLVNAEIDKIPEVAQALADLDGVSDVYSVTGDIDLVALVKVREYEDLRSFASQDLEEAFHLGLE